MGRWSLGRKLGLHHCRKKGLGKVHWQFGYGVVERRVGKSGWSRLGVCEFIWGFNILYLGLSCDIVCVKLFELCLWTCLLNQCLVNF